MMKKIIAITICIIICIAAYLFSPLGTGRYSLTDKQIDSLCAYYAGEPENEEDIRTETTCQAAVKIFGVQNKGEFRTVYGYVSHGECLKHKDKAYEIGGGNYEFMADIELAEDEIHVIKEYGDGVSSASTYEDMPFRYRFQLKNYDAYDASGYCRLGKEADKKAETVLGVPVETKYTLSIDGKYYEIYEINSEGNVDIQEKGRTDDL